MNEEELRADIERNAQLLRTGIGWVPDNWSVITVNAEDLARLPFAVEPASRWQRIKWRWYDCRVWVARNVLRVRAE